MRLSSVFPALAVLVLALLATGLAARLVQRDLMSLEHRQFAVEANDVKSALSDTMRVYEQTLRAGVGLFNTTGNLTKEQWHTFVGALGLEKDFSGFQGLGYVKALKREEVGAFEDLQRRSGEPDFNIRPKDSRSFYTAIVFLQPEDWRNKRALGYDMFSEGVRRKAMERARDTGQSALSGKVKLIQETNSDVQPGTLLYLPVYQGGIQPATVEERKEKLNGFLYGAFRMHDLVASVLRQLAPGVTDAFRIQVFDGATQTRDTLLFDSRETGQTSAEPRFRQALPIEFAGEKWNIVVSGDRLVSEAIDRSKPWLVLSGGIIISLLVAGITAFLAIARDHLQRSSERLSVEVDERKKAQEAVEMANNELIHRVKNTLAVVSAISSQTARYSASLDEFVRSFRERLTSLARVQDLLRPNSQAVTDLASLVREILAPYCDTASPSLTVDGPNLPVARNDIMLLSLTINELATNATKYGAWTVPAGRVAVMWTIEDAGDGAGSSLNLKWIESGGPKVSVPEKRGFGSNVMKFAVERGLRGKIDVVFDSEGVRYDIRLPLKSAEDQAPPQTSQAA